MRVTILGAGLMGAQIGCEYALTGHEVTHDATAPGVVERVRRRGSSRAAPPRLKPWMPDLLAAAAERRDLGLAADLLEVRRSETDG